MANPSAPPPSGYPSQVSGENLGLPFPTSIEALRAAGASFLTAAFRATGALAADNAVAAITDRCPGRRPLRRAAARRLPLARAQLRLMSVFLHVW